MSASERTTRPQHCCADAGGDGGNGGGGSGGRIGALKLGVAVVSVRQVVVEAAVALPTTTCMPPQRNHGTPGRYLEIAIGDAGWNLRRVLDHHNFHPFGAVLQ